MVNNADAPPTTTLQLLMFTVKKDKKDKDRKIGLALEVQHCGVEV